MPDGDAVLNRLLGGLTIPRNRILYMHARLRRLRQLTGMPYLELSRKIVRRLMAEYGPATILVPTQTSLSFRKSGVFHLRFSRSEEGRFSEDVRRELCAYRTPDPMYSVADVTGLLSSRERTIVYDRTFGDGTLFHHLLREDAVILNLDLADDMRFMSHEPEYRRGIDYRRHETFEGVIYLSDTEWRSICYHAWVRSVDAAGNEQPQYDRARIRRCFERAGALEIREADGVELCWMTAQASAAALERALDGDPHALVQRHEGAANSP